MSYKFQTGCIPCSFVCSCCDNHYYRCSSGVGMYYRGSSNKYDRILCEYCYQECRYRQGCEIIREQEEGRQKVKIQETIDQDY